MFHTSKSNCVISRPIGVAEPSLLISGYGVRYRDPSDRSQQGHHITMDHQLGVHRAVNFCLASCHDANSNIAFLYAKVRGFDGREQTCFDSSSSSSRMIDIDRY